jgi:hypothetical protein
MFPPRSPSHLPSSKKSNGKLEWHIVRIDLRVAVVRYRLGFIRRIPNVKNSYCSRECFRKSDAGRGLQGLSPQK